MDRAREDQLVGNPQRRALVDQVFGMRSLEDVAAAEAALDAWMAANPDDRAGSDLGHVIANMREALESGVSEPAVPEAA